MDSVVWNLSVGPFFYQHGTKNRRFFLTKVKQNKKKTVQGHTANLVEKKARETYVISSPLEPQVSAPGSLLQPATCPTRLYCSGTRKSCSLPGLPGSPLLSLRTGELLSYGDTSPLDALLESLEERRSLRVKGSSVCSRSGLLWVSMDEN